MTRAVAAGCAALALALSACGGGGTPDRTAPTDRVRAAADAYLGALAAHAWSRACRLMTPGARRDLADAAGSPCPRALAAGASSAEEVASARREVPGAVVRIRGRAASIGPFGPSQQALRLQRVGGGWLVAG
jgi:hypothetical protein